ncbi:MAG: putative mRNA 3-end processing factor/DNA ligase-1 [Acidobacteria bacterium]|nr:putative mRNA 3-end processing factor/DNA ligase-1 [Acidobacteriota bacterium]
MLGSLFQCDPDLHISDSEIYLDPREPRRIGVVSHGHSDHIGRHEHFIATPATAEFLRIRAGDDLRGTELGFRVPHVIGENTVELFPAGHILGSAMVRVTNGRGSLLYTGDFKLSPSFTAEPAEVPKADAVVMESTFGSPEYVFPPREELRDRLVDLVREVIRRDRTPILLAYSLGKAQEAAAMLRDSGVPLVMHRVVARISAVYERHGVSLGDYEVWGRQASMFGRSTNELRGKAIIIPPHMTDEIRRVHRGETIALTGWALQGRQEAEHGIPLSDHADFNELVTFAETCRASTIYVTHGAKGFAEELRKRGIRAEFLRRVPQLRLF